MKRVITFRSISSFISVSIFLTTEIFVVLGAAVWAFSGLFGLGRTATIWIGVIGAVPCIYASVRCAILAFEAETSPENA